MLNIAINIFSGIKGGAKDPTKLRARATVVIIAQVQVQVITDFFLLLESGDFLLQENGDNIIL